MTLAIRTLAAAALLVCSAGCESTLTGNEGNLLFSYNTVDQLSDFNKPVAVGAKLDLTVREAGTKVDVNVLSASSTSPGVLGVAGIDTNDRVVLEGRSGGTAVIEVRARMNDGRIVEDSVNMQAAVPQVLELGHVCTPDADAAYLVDSDILLPFDMKLSSGTNLVGYGLHPVDVTPAEGLSFDESSKDQEFFHVRTGSTVGRVTVSSQVDDTEIGLDLVRVGDIDGGEKSPGSLGDQVRVGASTSIRMLPTVAGEFVCCPQTRMTVDNDTPELCDVTGLGIETCILAGFVAIQGKAEGECTFRVTWPDAGDGAGVEATGVVDVIP